MRLQDRTERPQYIQCRKDLQEPEDQAPVSSLCVEIFGSQLGQQVWNCVKTNNDLSCVNCVHC